MTALSENKSSTVPTEEELRERLKLHEPNDVTKLLSWLDTTPEPTATLLTRIARDAESNSERLNKIHEKLAGAVIILAMAFLLLRNQKHESFWTVENPESFWIVATIGLIAFVISLAQDLMCRPSKARVANHAALLLGRTGDVRAIEYLANLWTPHPRNSNEAEFNADVSRELTRLLVANEGQWFSRMTEKALRRVVERAFPSRLTAEWRGRFHTRRDLTEADTDLLLAVVRHLSAPHTRRKLYTAEPTADHAALNRVLTIQPHGANAELLRDTVQALVKQRGSTAP